jgi:hypothetical protein
MINTETRLRSTNERNGTETTDYAKGESSSMSNVKHYPTHPGAEHPPSMTCEIPLEEYENLKRENTEIKAKLESVQATAYAESVDAGMRERKLKRALWMARAKSAKDAECRYHRLAQKEVCDPQPHGWSCYINGEVYPTGKMSRKLEPHYWCDIWDEVERKCRAKAEQYK